MCSRPPIIAIYLFCNGGLRFDEYGVSAKKQYSQTSSSTAEIPVAPACGTTILVRLLKPIPITSIYWAYGTSSDPVGSGARRNVDELWRSQPDLAARSVFTPIQSRAQEVGDKWELFDRHLLTTVALFRTDVSNARELIGSASSPTGTITDGAAYHVQGIDMGAQGNITDKWSVYTGLVLMTTRVDQSAVPTNIGLPLAFCCQPILQRAEQIQPHRHSRSRWAGNLPIENLRRDAARRQSREPSSPGLLALRRLRGRQARPKTGDGKLFVNNIFNALYYDAFYQSAAPVRCRGSGPLGGRVFSSLHVSRIGLIPICTMNADLRAGCVKQGRGGAEFRAAMDVAVWEDGRSTAGAQSAMVKQNEQLPPNGESVEEAG